MMMVPRNSDMGCAALWRIAIALTSFLYSSLILIKRCNILCSAMNALMMRRPPSVSSSWANMSPQRFCTVADCDFNLRLTLPMIQPASGATTMTNTVNCQLTVSMVAKHTIMAIGWRISMSILLVMEFSTAPTSADIRAIISPFRSSEKKLSGSFSTFSYTSIRMSRTTPVRNGIMMADEAK